MLRRATEVSDIPGVAAMACSRDAMLYEGAFGTRKLGVNKPMALDSVVWIASLTKPITSAGVMQLVERGRIGLDDAVGNWVPELAAVQVLQGFDAMGLPRLRAPKRPITLRHLLTHTSGYGYGMWNEPIARYMEATGMPPTSTCENAALRPPLLFDPGERWNYGINLELTGKVIEAVSGQKLGVYLRENLFGPLGMESTDFRITPSMRKRMARLHKRDADGVLIAGDFEVPQEPEFEMGGGGLYSTAANYLAFVRMILNRGSLNGERVLEAETVDRMSRNHIGELRVTRLRTVNSLRSNDVEFFAGVPKSWGLGFMINHDKAPTGRCAGGLAWAGLSNCYFWIDPSAGIGGVYMTQILPFADVKALPLYLDFETAVYRSLS
ncbi:MAG: beta-lactamase family protein [Prolixibacteraceae bacterium]|nr:beta-lactamase family protein [Burkholderiales bacterium]